MRWAAAVAAALLVLVASPAWGHAVLVESDPPDGATLDTPPRVIRLVFNEPVGAPVAAVRVFDSSGRRVDRGDAGNGPTGEQVEVTVPELEAGAYVVTWRATSADSHPVRGAFVFEVGAGAAPVDESTIAVLLGGSREVPWAVAGWLLRLFTYGGALVAAGGVIFAWVVARRPWPVVNSLIRRAALVGLVGSILQIPVLSAQVTGLGWSALLSPPAWSDVFTSSLALAALIRALSLGVIWGIAGRELSWWLAAPVAGVVGAELLTGHTRTTDPAWLVMGADAVHVLAAAMWLGGLAALTLSLRTARTAGDAAGGAYLVGRFSNLATWSVTALFVGGVALAWLQVGAPYALTSTAYGWTLVAKSSVAILILGVAAYNNRVLVPAVARRSPGAWNRLSRTVRVELGGLVLVLAATALLVNLQPAPEAAGVAGPFATYVPFGEHQLHVVVDPNRVGSNEVHFYVLTPGGFPALLAGAAEIELEMPATDIGPIVRTPQVAGPGHYLHVGPELTIPGEWVITFRQQVSEFEETTAVVEVRVNP